VYDVIGRAYGSHIRFRVKAGRRSAILSETSSRERAPIHHSAVLETV
jgi:hypothetical protein